MQHAIKHEVLARRRRDFMHFIPDGIAILPTAPLQRRNADVSFAHRPDSDFYYLTNFPEPEAVAVFAPGRANGEYLLFCRPRDDAAEIWESARQGLAGAVDNYAADQAFDIAKLHDKLPQLLLNRKRIYTAIGRYPDFDRKLIQMISKLQSRHRIGVHHPEGLVDLGHILHEMRIIKKKDEQQRMRQAAKLSAAAHQCAMQAAAPGKFEYQIQAELEYQFRLGGSQSTAYPCIVAGGANACILHYTDNNAELKDGDLLLIDAGAELDCYAADISRTFPVNGKFSGAQRAVYEVVLAAQKAAIEEVAKSRPFINYHNRAVEVLTDGLIELGLLRGERNELIETNACKRFYMHNTGHWLGMDVHDVGDYKIDDEWRLLESGMVLTVEPGLYIKPADDIDARWHNLGVRIEDDILVTANGNENLSAGAPKEIDEIEAVMREAAYARRL